MACLTEQANARRRGNRRGTMLVEAAIVMTLLIMMTMGLLQYGWVFTKWSQIQDAARQGVRTAVLPSTTANSTIFNGSKNGVIDTMMSNDGLGSSGYTVTTYVTHNGTSTQEDISNAVTGDIIKIVVSVSYGSNSDAKTNPVGNLPSWLVPTPTSLTSTVSMTKEGT